MRQGVDRIVFTDMVTLSLCKVGPRSVGGHRSETFQQMESNEPSGFRRWGKRRREIGVIQYSLSTLAFDALRVALSLRLRRPQMNTVNFVDIRSLAWRTPDKLLTSHRPSLFDQNIRFSKVLQTAQPFVKLPASSL